MPIKKPPPEKSLPVAYPEFEFALKRDTADVDYIPRREGGYFRAGLHRPSRPSTGLPPYQYSPLPSSSEYVRCLILQPGQADDDIVISLEPVRLEGSVDKRGDETKDAPFEALSYTWGTSRRDRPVTCEGGEIFVTRSLDLALRRLRRSTGLPRRLWADSICINQADPDEKGAQVALMGTIYLRAERVLIYLGAHDYNLAAEAISLIDDTNSTKLHAITSKYDVTIPFAQNDDPIIADERWKAFSLMLRQIWFTRGWTIQEAWLAQNAVVLWGENDLEVSWLDLVRTYLWVEACATNAGLGLRHDLTMAEVHRTMFARARPAEARVLGVDDCDGSFLEVLEQARVVAMTDPRDRIYAFLALAAAGGEDGSDAGLIRTIQPNYKDPFHHAYLEFALNYVRSSRDGRLLHHVIHDEETLVETQLPSWVPRWNIGSYNSSIPMGPTCMTVDLLDLSPATSQPETPSGSDSNSSSQTREWCLRTHGVLMDTVTSVLSLPPPEALDIEDHIVPLLASTWFDLEEATEGGPPVAYAPHMVTTAVLRCLTMGRHAGDPETWPDHMLEYCQHVKALTFDWLRRRGKLGETGDEEKEDKTVAPGKEDQQQVNDVSPSQGEPESTSQDFLELIIAELSRQGIGLPISGEEEVRSNGPFPTRPEAEDQRQRQQQEGGQSDSSSGVDKVHDIVKSSARNRVFVRTARGYYGLAPGPTTAGDVLAVLSGGYVPFALRQVEGRRRDGNARCFKVIGQTWVESVMFGPVCDEGPGWQDWRAWGAEEEEIILV
ncbi:unnamed protein product [Clonostachys rosea]|uniref:Heterokaryon incompatibility domain-containing protein n=1 Tax=Bionectria ochroleuca TaxID=29856 RepID=A0ABY6USD8_BIOOC|nr:unnamed protein product [Clonostachys rosea]